MVAHVHDHELLLNADSLLQLGLVYFGSECNLAVLHSRIDHDIADGIELVNDVVNDGSINIFGLGIVAAQPHFGCLDQQFHLEVVLPDHLHHSFFIFIDDNYSLFQGFQEQRPIVDQHQSRK